MPKKVTHHHQYREEKDHCLDLFLCFFAYIAAVVFMFSSIALISSWDYLANGLEEDGNELYEFGTRAGCLSFLFIVCVCLRLRYSLPENEMGCYVWAYIPSLLFAVALICLLLAKNGMSCGRCTRLYLRDVEGELDNSGLERAYFISSLIIQSMPVYTYVIIVISMIREEKERECLFAEALCETIYCLLLVFLPLFMVALCCLTGGEGGINCSSQSSGSYNGTVYNGSGQPIDSRLEMV